MIDLYILKATFSYLGESTVVWKHGESVIFAGDIRIRKDLRIKLVEGTSLYIKEATRGYAGKYILVQL